MQIFCGKILFGSSLFGLMLGGTISEQAEVNMAIISLAGQVQQGNASDIS